jgi:serine/threonine kinase 32
MSSHHFRSTHQMKQANFDVTHELDEFLMVEKPLTHSRRKTNTDLDKLKPELRQLEEQYVFHHPSLILFSLSRHRRFTLYDFSHSQRLSYYPHNQPVISLGVDAENGSQSTTGTLVPGATVAERSLAGTPVVSENDHQQQTRIHTRTPSHGRGDP